MKNTLFISDIHLGDPDFEDEEKLDLLFTGRSWAAIYILGDLIDTWESTIALIIAKYMPLIKVINEVAKITSVNIIKGNHDPDVWTLARFFPNAHIFDYTHKVFIGGKSVIMAHGEKMDPLNPYLYFLAWLYRKMKAKFDETTILRKITEWISSKFYGISKKPWAVQDRNAVKEWKDEAEVIITGHTHTVKMLEMSNLIYINTGTVLPPVKTYVIHNGQTGRFEIHKL